MGRQTVGMVKVTRYFQVVHARAGRASIQDSWIERAMHNPLREAVQTDSRIRWWTQIAEVGGRYLRVVLLEDAETVHNAFFDRGFAP